MRLVSWLKGGEQSARTGKKKVGERVSSTKALAITESEKKNDEGRGKKEKGIRKIKRRVVDSALQ